MGAAELATETQRRSTLEAELEAQRVEATRVRVALAGAPAAEVDLAAAYATPEAAQAIAQRRGD